MTTEAFGAGGRGAGDRDERGRRDRPAAGDRRGGAPGHGAVSGVLRGADRERADAGGACTSSCVRNVLVRKRYRPPPAPAQGADAVLAAALEDGCLTARELLGRYCTTVYARTGSYQGTARRLALDRRTVKQHVDLDLLERLHGGTSAVSS